MGDGEGCRSERSWHDYVCQVSKMVSHTMDLSLHASRLHATWMSSLQFLLSHPFSSSSLQIYFLFLIIPSFFCFFLRLFEINPSLQDMFSFKNQDLTNNELLENHAVSLMETIDTVVNLVKENEIETLTSQLVELGIGHSINKVTPKHFAVRIFAILPIRKCIIYCVNQWTMRLQAIFFCDFPFFSCAFCFMCLFYFFSVNFHLFNVFVSPQMTWLSEVFLWLYELNCVFHRT